MKNVIHILNNKVNCEIVIRLDDECNNGHEDFSITGTFWSPNTARHEKNIIRTGCCHNEILSVVPEYSVFVKLHLNDFRGYPMYYIKNGFYHLKHSKKEDFKRWYLVEDDEFDILQKANTEDEFAWLLIVHLKNQNKWHELAKEGIKLLESYTDEKFVSKATRLQEVKYLDGKNTDEYNLKYFNINN